MDAMESSSPSLRHKLRTTVCGCFGSPSSTAQVGGRARWRRRVAAAGEFRYDPLSYALNFDDGGSNDADRDTDEAAFRYRDFNSRLPPSPPPAIRRLTAVVIA